MVDPKLIEANKRSQYLSDNPALETRQILNLFGSDQEAPALKGFHLLMIAQEEIATEHLSVPGLPDNERSFWSGHLQCARASQQDLQDIVETCRAAVAGEQVGMPDELDRPPGG